MITREARTSNEYGSGMRAIMRRMPALVVGQIPVAHWTIDFGIVFSVNLIISNNTKIYMPVQGVAGVISVVQAKSI